MGDQGEPEARNYLELAEPLQVLKPDQIMEVDRALASLGPFGEVRLIKVKGRLRFIERLESHNLSSNGGAPETE